MKNTLDWQPVAGATLPPVETPVLVRFDDTDGVEAHVVAVMFYSPRGSRQWDEAYTRTFSVSGVTHWAALA